MTPTKAAWTNLMMSIIYAAITGWLTYKVMVIYESWKKW